MIAYKAPVCQKTSEAPVSSNSLLRPEMTYIVSSGALNSTHSLTLLRLTADLHVVT